MPTSQHHFLAAIKLALQTHADRPAFCPYTGPSHSWTSFSYRDVEAHIVAAQLKWSDVKKELDLQQGDVIGCWLTGRKYEDIINIIGLSMVGLVPQLFSTFYSLALASELLARSSAKALVYDAEFAPSATQLPIPVFPTITLSDILSLSSGGTLGDLPAVEPDDSAFIGHTSGSTGGTPKILPQTHRWTDHIVRHKYHIVCDPPFDGQIIINVFGSLAHVGSFCGFLGAICAGVCTVQPSSPQFSAEELLAMIQQCKLNTAMMYSTFLANHFKAAREDRKTLAALQSLRLILFMGVALEKEEEQWAYDEANKLHLRNYFATSECAPLLASSVGHEAKDKLLRPMKGAYGQLIPRSSDGDLSAGTLFELIMPAGVPDAPHKSLFSVDGLYHTGDIFEKVDENGYVYRGRANDWIKVVPGFVDTVSIENAVRLACSDLVHDLVIVGENRPWPVLLVETIQPPPDADNATSSIAQSIVTRMQSFNESRYAWDRIDDPRRILVIQQGELLRTGEKGNVRRFATAEKFKQQIDAIFDV